MIGKRTYAKKYRWGHIHKKAMNENILNFQSILFFEHWVNMVSFVVCYRNAT